MKVVGKENNNILLQISLDDFKCLVNMARSFIDVRKIHTLYVNHNEERTVDLAEKVVIREINNLHPEGKEYEEVRTKV